MAAPALLLAGCVSSGGSDTVKPLASDISTTSFVSEIDLRTPPANASPGFKEVFVSKVSEKLKGCAKGTRPLKLVVDITEFKRANPAMTMLVGSSNVIHGSAKLQDPATNAVVADYDINRSFGAGGLLGVAAMSQAEEQMSSAFGDELCKRAFIRR
ncbi:MAG: hypothetical protein ABW360_17185 [Phenylobacterium sp.]